MKKMKNGRVIPYCIKEKEGMRRQDIPTAYKRSGDVYVTKRDLVMKKNRLFGDYIVGYLVPSERAVDINNELIHPCNGSLNEVNEKINIHFIRFKMLNN